MERLEAIQTRRIQSDLVGGALIAVGILYGMATAIAFTREVSMWFFIINGLVAGVLIAVGVKFMQGIEQKDSVVLEVKKRIEVKE